jgi:hypothetical protein
VAGVAPRVRPVSLAKDHMLLSGLEPLKVLPCNFTLFPTVTDDIFSLQNLPPDRKYLFWFTLEVSEFGISSIIGQQIIHQNCKNKMKWVLIFTFK